MKFLIRTERGKAIVWPNMIDYIDGEIYLLVEQKYEYHAKVSLADYEQIIGLVMGGGNRRDGVDLINGFNYIFTLN